MALAQTMDVVMDAVMDATMEKEQQQQLYSSSQRQSQQQGELVRLISCFTTLLSCAVSDTEQNGVIEQPLQSCANELPSLFVSGGSVDEVDRCCCCCRVPSLDLTGKNKDSPALFHPTSSKHVLENVAANNLRHSIEIRRHELVCLPSRMLINWSKSFVYLIDSRLKSSKTALLRRSMRNRTSRGGGQGQQQEEEEESLARLLVKLLGSPSNPITPVTVVSNFRTLECLQQPHDTAGVSLMPLVAEAVFDLKVFGQIIPIKIDAPGTIQASFSTSEGNNSNNNNSQQKLLLSNVEVMIDTPYLLNNMMTKARDVVRQTISIASNIASSILLAQKAPPPVFPPPIMAAAAAAAAALVQQQQQQQQQAQHINIHNNGSQTLPPTMPMTVPVTGEHQQKTNTNNNNSNMWPQQQEEHPSMPPPPIRPPVRRFMLRADADADADPNSNNIGPSSSTTTISSSSRSGMKEGEGESLVSTNVALGATNANENNEFVVSSGKLSLLTAAVSEVKREYHQGVNDGKICPT